MEFFIKKNATLPVLKMQVVKDGRSDYQEFMNLIESSSIVFTMIDIETGIPKITSKPAGFVSKTFIDPNTPTEYYIYYQFTSRDTNRVGRYEGQFLLKNEQGNLIVPIRENLFINVQESFIDDDYCCGPTLIIPTPCPTCPTCPEPTPTPVTTTTTINPGTTTTTTENPYTTTTTTMSGVTSWTIAEGVGDIDYFCDGDLTMFSVLYTNTMDKLTPGVRLYGFPDLSGDPIFLNEQSFYMVFERNGVPLTNRYSINPEGGLSWVDAPRYVGNVYNCGDPIPCRTITFTRNTNQNTTINCYTCDGLYHSEIISLGQTIEMCGSYPVYKTGISVTIGNNC